MSCEACERAFNDGDKYFPFRWYMANVIVFGCRQHVAEIFKVLRASMDREEKEEFDATPSEPKCATCGGTKTVVDKERSRPARGELGAVTYFEDCPECGGVAQ